MIAVLFEAVPADGMWDAYLDTAAGLRGELNNIPGFIAVERFQSLSQSKKVLSLSFWRDEESIRRWRTTAAHRRAQHTGRHTIFDQYRIRVAAVLRDYSRTDRKQAPDDSNAFHL
jgi:heme-degrading monooxygenase HmoA